MLNYFEKFRDIFADECHPKSEEDWAKIYEEHGDLFKQAYAEFEHFYDDYLYHRDNQGGYNRNAKYPWGFKAKFQTVSEILYKLNDGTYHIKTFYNDVTHHNWKQIHRDVKYALEYWDKVKVPENAEWDKMRRQEWEIS